MNRSFLIILIPAVLVLTGYIIVLRIMGFSPGYFRLIVVVTGFLTALWLVRRKTAGKSKPTGQ